MSRDSAAMRPRSLTSARSLPPPARPSKPHAHNVIPQLNPDHMARHRALRAKHNAHATAPRRRKPNITLAHRSHPPRRHSPPQARRTRATLNGPSSIGRRVRRQDGPTPRAAAAARKMAATRDAPQICDPARYPVFVRSRRPVKVSTISSPTRPVTTTPTTPGGLHRRRRPAPAMRTSPARQLGVTGSARVPVRDQPNV